VADRLPIEASDALAVWLRSASVAVAGAPMDKDDLGAASISGGNATAGGAGVAVESREDSNTAALWPNGAWAA
jgi:hypothetical protein